MKLKTNREGLTYAEWRSAGGSLPHTIRNYGAWIRGEDPTEYRADAPKRRAS